MKEFCEICDHYLEEDSVHLTDEEKEELFEAEDCSGHCNFHGYPVESGYSCYRFKHS